MRKNVKCKISLVARLTATILGSILLGSKTIPVANIENDLCGCVGILFAYCVCCIFVNFLEEVADDNNGTSNLYGYYILYMVVGFILSLVGGLAGHTIFSFIIIGVTPLSIVFESQL